MSKLRRPTLALAIVASLSLAACDRPADPAAGTAAPAEATPAAAKPMLGSFGFDASGMDQMNTALKRIERYWTEQIRYIY